MHTHRSRCSAHSVWSTRQDFPVDGSEFAFARRRGSARWSICFLRGPELMGGKEVGIESRWVENIYVME